MKMKYWSSVDLGCKSYKINYGLGGICSVKKCFVKNTDFDL